MLVFIFLLSLVMGMVFVDAQEAGYDFTIHKTANPQTVVQGEVVTFNISVINTGVRELHGIHVVDSKLNIEDTIDLLFPGQRKNYQRVKTMTEVGIYTNTAIASFSSGDFYKEVYDEISVTVLKPVYDYKFENTANSEIVFLGEEVIFKIRIKNTGNKVLNNIRILNEDLAIDKTIEILEVGKEEIVTRKKVMDQLGTYRNTAAAFIKIGDDTTAVSNESIVMVVKPIDNFEIVYVLLVILIGIYIVLLIRKDQE